MEDQDSRNMVGDQEVIWLSDLHSLPEIIDNFNPPVLVKVVDGYMLSEEDCLASDTILTVHGQHKMQKILATDTSGKELSIPIDCQYKVRVTPYSEAQVYKTVKDVCEIPYLPECIENTREFKFHWKKYPSSTAFQVRSVLKCNKNKAKGLSVTTIGQEPQTMTLPLSLRGDFQTVPLPNDRNRNYLIKDLLSRNFPIFVEFLQTNEQKPAYGPRLGVVKLKQLYESNVIYATNYINNKRYITTFSRELNVQLQIGRVMVVEEDQTYSTIAESTEEPVDDLVLNYLLKSDPYIGDYNTSIYQDIQDIVYLKSKKEDENAEKPPVPDRSSRNSITSTRSGSMYMQMKGEQDTSEKELQKDNTKEAYSYAVVNQPTSFKQKIFRSIKQDRKKSAYETIDDEIPRDNPENPYTKAPYIPRSSQRVSIKQKPSRNADKEERESGEYSCIGDTSGTSVGCESNGSTLGIEEHIGRRNITPIERNEGLELKASNDSNTNNAPSTETKTRNECSSNKNNLNLDQLKTTEDHQLKEGIPETLMKVLALSLPLNKAASLQYQFDADTSDPEKATEAAARPQLPIPLPKKVKNDAGATVAARSQKGRPPPVPPRSTSSVRSSRVGHDADLNTKAASQDYVDGKGASEPTPMNHEPQPNRKLTTKDDTQLKEALEYDSVDDEGKLAPRDNIQATDAADNNSSVPEQPTSAQSSLEHQDTVKLAPQENTQKKDARVYARRDLLVGRIGSMSRRSEVSSIVIDDDTVSEEIRIKTEEEICEILRKLNLSEFIPSFEAQQIDGSLLGDLDEEDLVKDINMSRFQARKLWLYIRGWILDEENTEGNENRDDEMFINWTTEEVGSKLRSIKLDSFAEFCIGNQVNGALLGSILDKETLQSIRENHQVVMSGIEERKLSKFVLCGWRPSTNK